MIYASDVGPFDLPAKFPQSYLVKKKNGKERSDKAWYPLPLAIDSKL